MIQQPNLRPNVVYKQNVPNLSVSYADSSLYQREPVLRFVEVADLYKKNSLNSLK